MKKLLIALFALLVLTVVPSALAMGVDIKGESFGPVSVIAGESVPVRVTSVFSEDYSDVVLKAELSYGHGKDVDYKSKALDVIAGTTYVQNLDLEIPADIEVTVPGQTYTLSLVLKDKTGRTIDSQEVDVTVQRNNDELEIQKVITNYALAGEPTLITVIAKNIGSDEQEDVYVKVSIPELNLVAEERMGDIAAVDSDGDEDVASVDMPIQIPENAAKGIYTMIVEVYNDNVDVKTTKTIAIDGVGEKAKFVEVVSLINSQSIGQSETATYVLRIANLGDSAEAYTIAVEGTEGWATYQINPLALALSAGSEQTINIAVTANKNALAGEHLLKVKVISNKGAEKTVSLTANVQGSTAGFDAMLISVIVLAIVLIILIVLLVKTRKASEDISKTEESYY